jgi:hypothetical protein
MALNLFAVVPGLIYHELSMAKIRIAKQGIFIDNQGNHSTMQEIK